MRRLQLISAVLAAALSLALLAGCSAEPTQTGRTAAGLTGDQVTTTTSVEESPVAANPTKKGVIVDGQSVALAPKEVATMLEGRIAAMNRADGKAAAAFYAVDGVLEEFDLDPPLVTTGRASIADRLQELTADMGLRLESMGAPIQYDRYVAQPVRFYPAEGPGKGAGMLMFEINEKGEIQHQWEIGWVTDQP